MSRIFSRPAECSMDGCSIVHTWAEHVDTRARFDADTVARLSAILRRNTVAPAALRPVAARDAARVPLRPITELN